LRDKQQDYFNSTPDQVMSIESYIDKYESFYSEINDLPYPVATKYSKKTLWLPSSLTLTDSQIEYICDTIKGFYVSAR
jgi:dTDP-4-amino-4,6-dideoxygalactose transaminase